MSFFLAHSWRAFVLTKGDRHGANKNEIATFVFSITVKDFSHSVLLDGKGPILFALKLDQRAGRRQFDFREVLDRVHNPTAAPSPTGSRKEDGTVPGLRWWMPRIFRVFAIVDALSLAVLWSVVWIIVMVGRWVAAGPLLSFLTARILRTESYHFDRSEVGLGLATDRVPASSVAGGLVRRHDFCLRDPPAAARLRTTLRSRKRQGPLGGHSPIVPMPPMLWLRTRAHARKLLQVLC
jgi:hypothetical protein